MLLQSIVAILLVGFISADEQVKKANAYIDQFIAQATNESGAFIDPLPLEEISKGFEQKVGFVMIKGEAKLHNGSIIGLSTIERVGDASVMDLDDLLIISCSLRFKKIKAFYRGALTVNNLGPKITINAEIGSSNVAMFFTVPTEGGNATLLSFSILKLSNIRVSVWGLGLWGWGTSIVSSLALNTLEKPVAKYASTKVFDVFSKEIAKVPYPGNGSPAENE